MTEDKTDQTPKFGEKIREDFYLRPGSTFVNHGAYGVVPRQVKRQHIRLQEVMEEHPDDWFRRQFKPRLTEVRETVAKFFNTRLEDTFLVQNATTANNAVMKSYPLKCGDAVLITNLTYCSVEKTAKYVVGRVEGAELVTLDVKFPLESEDEVIRLYEDTFQKHPNIKIAVVDHITSSTSILLPVRRITQVCHQYGAVVFLDGAHAPGQLPLSLPDIDADFYTGNFHKWMFTPKSCAVLWQNPARAHDWLSPVVTTVSLGQGHDEEFAFEGTKDNTAYLCTVYGIQYLESLGGLETVTAYNTKLRQEAAGYLVSAWGTSTLPVPVNMEAPFMQLVRLPDIPGYSRDQEGADQIFSDLYTREDVQTNVIYLQGDYYARLSVQVYNTIQDFHNLKEAVDKLIQWKSC